MLLPCKQLANITIFTPQQLERRLSLGETCIINRLVMLDAVGSHSTATTVGQFQDTDICISINESYHGSGAQTFTSQMVLGVSRLGHGNVGGVQDLLRRRHEHGNVRFPCLVAQISCSYPGMYSLPFCSAQSIVVENNGLIDCCRYISNPE